MKKKVFIKQVLIEEFYRKIGNKVYWVWRFASDKKWNMRLTPYTNLPYVELPKGFSGLKKV